MTKATCRCDHTLYNNCPSLCICVSLCHMVALCSTPYYHLSPCLSLSQPPTQSLYNRNSSILRWPCVTHYVSAVTVRSVAWHHGQHLPPVSSSWRSYRQSSGFLDQCLPMESNPITIGAAQPYATLQNPVPGPHFWCHGSACQPQSFSQTDSWQTYDSMGHFMVLMLEHSHLISQILFKNWFEMV